MPGYDSFIGYDPENKITIIVWDNMNRSIESKLTANTIMLKLLDQIY
jgi:D-alanyl-D-alanine carboxypeptidase